MNAKVVILMGCLAAAALARPRNDIVDFETDYMEVEQEGTPGRSVTGEYSWVAPNGQEYTVKYIADNRGYRVLDTDATPTYSAPANVYVDDVVGVDGEGAPEVAEPAPVEEEAPVEETVPAEEAAPPAEEEAAPAEEEGAEEEGGEEEGGAEEEEGAEDEGGAEEEEAAEDEEEGSENEEDESQSEE